MPEIDNTSINLQNLGARMYADIERVAEIMDMTIPDSAVYLLRKYLPCELSKLYLQKYKNISVTSIGEEVNS